MAHPPPEPTPRPPSRGLRLLDLVGFVAGFGLASLLARTIWPRFLDLSGPPVVAFALEFGWLGLAMSGPIILGLDRRRPAFRAPRRLERPGRPIGEVVAIPAKFAPAPAPPDAATRFDYSRAELAWMAIGGYWIALTCFVVPARATNAPWTMTGIVPVIGAIGLMVLLPRSARRGESLPPLGWTHAVAVGLLWTWPVAWGLLVLLSRTI